MLALHVDFAEPNCLDISEIAVSTNYFQTGVLKSSNKPFINIRAGVTMDKDKKIAIAENITGIGAGIAVGGVLMELQVPLPQAAFAASLTALTVRRMASRLVRGPSLG